MEGRVSRAGAKTFHEARKRHLNPQGLETHTQGLESANKNALGQSSGYHIRVDFLKKSSAIQ